MVGRTESPDEVITPEVTAQEVQERAFSGLTGRQAGRPKKWASVAEKNKSNYQQRKAKLSGDDLDKLRQLCEDRLHYLPEKIEPYIKKIQSRKMSLDEAVRDIFQKQHGQIVAGNPIRMAKSGGYGMQKIGEVDAAAHKNYVSDSGVVGAGGGKRHRNEGSGADTDASHEELVEDQFDVDRVATGLSRSRFYVKGGLRHALDPDELSRSKQRENEAREFLDEDTGREDTTKCKICGEVIQVDPNFNHLHYKADNPYDEAVMHILDRHADLMPYSGRRPRNFEGILKVWVPARNESVAKFIRPLSLKPDALRWATVECLFCGEYFRDFYQAVNHFISSHVTASKVKPWDGKTLKAEIKCRRERRTHIFITDSLDLANPFMCYKCWTVKGSYSEVFKHVLKAHGPDVDFSDIAALKD